MVEILLAAVWACCLLLEPILEAGLTEVLSTAASEVRVAENLCADTAAEPVRDWLGECQVVSTALRLVRDVCYCHLEAEDSEECCGCIGIERIKPSSGDNSWVPLNKIKLVNVAKPVSCTIIAIYVTL